MKLESIYIRRSYDHKTMKGNIEFIDEMGKVEINLNDEACRKIIAICASQIVETSKTLANEMTAKCLEIEAGVVVNLLEGTKDGSAE